MSGYTPGPWRVGSPGMGAGKVCTVEGRRIVGEASWYCEQAEANARLMAAAPDLLAACKDTLDYWETTGFADCDEGCDCIVDQMRAAIAKAEGK